MPYYLSLGINSHGQKYTYISLQILFSTFICLAGAIIRVLRYSCLGQQLLLHLGLFLANQHQWLKHGEAAKSTAVNCRDLITGGERAIAY